MLGKKKQKKKNKQKTFHYFSPILIFPFKKGYVKTNH